jgi:hypothetical protein
VLGCLSGTQFFSIDGEAFHFTIPRLIASTPLAITVVGICEDDFRWTTTDRSARAVGNREQSDPPAQRDQQWKVGSSIAITAHIRTGTWITGSEEHPIGDRPRRPTRLQQLVFSPGFRPREFNNAERSIRWLRHRQSRSDFAILIWPTFGHLIWPTLEQICLPCSGQPERGGDGQETEGGAVRGDSAGVSLRSRYDPRSGEEAGGASAHGAAGTVERDPAGAQGFLCEGSRCLRSKTTIYCSAPRKRRFFQDTVNGMSD